MVYSSTAEACVLSYCLVPVVVVYVCVIGAQREIEPRQPFHIQCTNQSHIIQPHTKYTKHTAAAKSAFHTYHWNACVPPFRPATPPGYQSNPVPKGKPCTLYSIHG